MFRDTPVVYYSMITFVPGAEALFANQESQELVWRLRCGRTCKNDQDPRWRSSQDWIWGPVYNAILGTHYALRGAEAAQYFKWLVRSPKDISGGIRSKITYGRVLVPPAMRGPKDQDLIRMYYDESKEQEGAHNMTKRGMDI